MEHPEKQGPSTEFEISEEIQSVTASYMGNVYRVAITPFLTMWSRLITQVNKDNPGLTDADKKQLRQQLFTFYNENREALESVITTIEDQQRREKMLADSDWENGSDEFKDIVEVRADVAKTLAIPASEIQAREKYQTVVRAAYRHLHSNGVFYYDPSRKISYWFDDDSKILHDLSSETFESFLCDRLSLNREDIAFSWCLTGIRDRSSIHGTKTEAKRLSFYDQEDDVLYWNNKPGRSLRIDGEKIIEVNNGEGALFLWDEDWEEFDCPSPESLKEPNGSFRELIYANMNIDEMETTLSLDEASSVIDVYVRTVLFHDILSHRPILALTGPWGCGKTLFATLIGLALFGKKFTVLGLEDEKQEGAVAYVTNSAYGVFDNADEWIKWLPDLLARVCTGQSIPKRVLYKTNELAKYPVDVVLAITARSTPWARPDVISRLLLFRMKQPPHFIDENLLKGRVLSARKALLFDLSRSLLASVRRLRQKKDQTFDSPSRLAGFYNFGLKVSEDLEIFKGAFGKILQAQGVLASEEQEVLISILLEWVEYETDGLTVDGKKKEWTTEKPTTAIFAELSQIAKNKSIELGIKSPTSLGMRLKSDVPFLRASGILVRWKRSREANVWTFSLTKEAKELYAKKVPQVPQPPQQSSLSVNSDEKCGTLGGTLGEASTQGSTQETSDHAQKSGNVEPVEPVEAFSGKVSSASNSSKEESSVKFGETPPSDLPKIKNGHWVKLKDEWMIQCDACHQFHCDKQKVLDEHRKKCPAIYCPKCDSNYGSPKTLVEHNRIVHKEGQH